MPEANPSADSAAVQFMILDFLQEILNFTDNPGSMGQFLVRKLRELMGVRTVVLLDQGNPASGAGDRIVALEPERARNEQLLAPLRELARLTSNLRDAAFFVPATAEPAVAAAMNSLGLSSLSLTPLRMGESRVGTLLGLDHLDLHRNEDVTRLLQVLSPVFALVLRNTLHYQSQESKVLAQAESFRALFQTSLDGFVLVGEGGWILDANQAYLRMSGYQLDEIRKRQITDLDALETPVETERHSEKIRQKGSDRFLSRHRRKDGSSFPVEVSTTHVPSQNLSIGFIRDLTVQANAETALRQSEAHHRELVEILGEGVSIADPNDTFTMANPEAERIFGVGPGGLTGRNLREFMDEEARQLVSNNTARRMAGQTDSYQIRIRRPDGKTRVLQVTATPRRDAEGRYTSSLGVFRDITDELKIQESLRLTQKMESLGHLAGGVAHDMNNVLSAILGLASAHLDSLPEGAPLHTALQTITKACSRGRNMVKSLLDFARQDMVGERPISVNALAQEEAKLLERSIPANIQIQLDLEPGVGSILGDPDALSLTLMNLCVNAVDAMPDGGSLLLRTRRLPEGLVCLSVEDTGAGMPPHVLEHATDPFFTTKPQGKGTGLGLSLAYSTVKAHHGTLHIQSAPDEGTVVQMRFPSAGREEEAPAPQSALASPTAKTPLQILLVDDDELIQSAVSMQLEALGHAAAVAESGEAALDLVTTGFRPDAVILDMNMPGWGGARTLPKLREALPGIPILLSTGRMDQQAIDLSHAFSEVLILPKPFGLEELSKAFANIRPAR